MLRSFCLECIRNFNDTVIVDLSKEGNSGTRRAASFVSKVAPISFKTTGIVIRRGFALFSFFGYFLITQIFSSGWYTCPKRKRKKKASSVEVLCTGSPVQSSLLQHSNRPSSSIASQFSWSNKRLSFVHWAGSNGREVVDVVEAWLMDDSRLGANESGRRRWRLPRSHRARKGRGLPKGQPF